MFSVFSSSPFDTLVDEATSELLPNAQEDLARNMEICDTIKGRAVPPPVAARALRRRLTHYNPNVQLLALRLTDACVKNCGRAMLREIAGREFVDCLTNNVLAAASTNTVVRTAAADLFQQWAIVFGQYSDLRYMQDAFETFRMERPEVVFPAPPADLAIDLVAETVEPPEWTDSQFCERCRAVFTVTNRKHHCRACGRTFCGPCSVKSRPIPEFGYNQPVRVCETCYHRKDHPIDTLSPATADGSHGSNSGRGAPADELDVAIELSLREQRIEEERRQAVKNEEEQLQAAIAASKADEQLNKQRLKQSIVSPVERENVHLFARLVEAGGGRGLRGDAEIARMAKDLRSIKLRIEEALLSGVDLERTDKGTPFFHVCSSKIIVDLERLKRVLEATLAGYDAIVSGDTAEIKREEADKIKDLIGL